jgi:hypothetical protein
MAAKKKWTREPSDQQLEEMLRPVEELLRQSLDGWRAATIAEWTREVRRIVLDTRERVEEIMEEKSMDYRSEEVNFFMQELGTWRWHLDKLLVTGVAPDKLHMRQAAY